MTAGGGLRLRPPVWNGGDLERNATLSTVLQVLTFLVSLVSAIGVLIANSKVDQLTGQVQALQERLVTHVTTPGMHAD